MLSRRRFPFAPLACVAAVLCASAIACGSSEREAFDGDGGTPGADAGITPSADGGSSGGLTGDSGTSGSNSGPAEVFVHSNDTLYKLDPNSAALELSKVGKFTGVTGSMVDIALNEDGEMYGTTYQGVYRIDKTTGAATVIKEAPGTAKVYPDSLSFVPKGTIEADREVLVGYVGSDYVQIDPDTGDIDVITRNALGNDLISSGDIVSIREGDFLTYLTVKPKDANKCTGECAPCKVTNCLLEVDPKYGTKISNLGDTKRPDVFGLAFWAGTVYGINTDGKLFKLQTTGELKATNIPIPGSLGSSKIPFFGAGSSTAAPIGPN